MQIWTIVVVVDIVEMEWSKKYGYMMKQPEDLVTDKMWSEGTPGYLLHRVWVMIVSDGEEYGN